MITTVINLSIPSVVGLGGGGGESMRTLKIYSLSKLKVYNSLTVVTVLYMRAPELTHLITGSFTIQPTSIHSPTL
jgi:hypothetical protein